MKIMNGVIRLSLVPGLRPFVECENGEVYFTDTNLPEGTRCQVQVFEGDQFCKIQQVEG